MEKTLKQHTEQTMRLLKELDDMIERDYQEALKMLEAFREGSLLTKEENLHNPLQLDIFETNPEYA